jgi:hypothetical protein
MRKLKRGKKKEGNFYYTLVYNVILNTLVGVGLMVEFTISQMLRSMAITPLRLDFAIGQQI